MLVTGEAIPYAEIELQRAGEKRYLTASVAVLNSGADAPPEAVGILRDMSRQKQIEQLKDDFLVTASHQLRTPVALLRGYVDTLRHLELSPEEQSKFINGIADTATRLEHLVGQVLDVTRIAHGHLDLEMEPVRLVDVLRGSINSIPQGSHRSRIWIDLAPELPLIQADLYRLEEVVINLLDNALEYSPATGQVVIRAVESVSDTGSKEVMVQVMDEGIGIPAEDQALVFEKFRRGSNVQSLHAPGTGLGLFICRSIIEAHGGRIALTSTLNTGTCVTFWVKAAQKGY